MAKVNKWIKVGAGHYEFMHDRKVSIKKLERGWEEEGYEGPFSGGPIIGDKWEATEDGEFLAASETLYTLKDVVEMEYDERIKEEVIE